LADGNANPLRSVAGQKALLARTAHGSDYDPVHDVFMITNFYAQSVQIYRADSNGEVAPVRIIQGPKTQLVNPDKVMMDSVNNEIYVPQGSKVLVFDGSGNGDIAPKRILGPIQGLGASNVDIDAVHNLVVVGGGGGGNGARFSVFDRTASGPDAKPKWIIQGPHTDLTRTQGPFAIQPTRGLIVSGVRTVEELGGPDNFVGVWDEMKGGDTPPLYKIGGPNMILEQVRGVVLNPKYKELIVSDKRVNGVLTYYFPEIF
jgi:hypothetical protein